MLTCWFHHGHKVVFQNWPNRDDLPREQWPLVFHHIPITHQAPPDSLDRVNCTTFESSTLKWCAPRKPAIGTASSKIFFLSLCIFSVFIYLASPNLFFHDEQQVLTEAFFTGLQWIVSVQTSPDLFFHDEQQVLTEAFFTGLQWIVSTKPITS